MLCIFEFNLVQRFSINPTWILMLFIALTMMAVNSYFERWEYVALRKAEWEQLY